LYDSAHASVEKGFQFLQAAMFFHHSINLVFIGAPFKLTFFISTKRGRQMIKTFTVKVPWRYVLVACNNLESCMARE